MSFSKFLLILLRVVLTAAEAALPVLISAGKIKSVLGQELAAYLSEVAGAITAISQELASADSGVVKTDKIRAIIEAVVLPNITLLPATVQFYFLAVDEALAAVLALFPAPAVVKGKTMEASVEFDFPSLASGLGDVFQRSADLKLAIAFKA